MLVSARLSVRHSRLAGLSRPARAKSWVVRYAASKPRLLVPLVTAWRAHPMTTAGGRGNLAAKCNLNAAACVVGCGRAHAPDGFVLSDCGDENRMPEEEVRIMPRRP